MSLTNGHVDTVHENHINSTLPLTRSESELSDLNDAPPSRNEAHGQAASEDDAMHDMATSEMDRDEDALGEEDAEYDAESPAPQPAGGMRDDRLSSEDSLRPARRKGDADDDDFMKRNPELYGLRRSGRARPARRVLESSDEEDEDEDDVNTGRRRKRQKTANGRPASLSKESSLQPASAAPTESEDDTYGGQKGKTFAKKHRQKLQAATSGGNTPNMSEVRFSTRRAAKVTTYTEQDDYGLSEEDTEMTPAYYYEEVDTRPAIDVVLNHRLKEGADKASDDKHDFEFYIKWQGQSHYHATWDTWASLSTYKGFRRLENYFRKTVRFELSLTQDPDIAVEDREKYNLDREAYIDSLNDYTQVERVIGRQTTDDGGTEYYVKWKGLYYDACTWEDADLVAQLAQSEIDRFIKRQQHLPVSNAKETSLATRADYKPFRTQPEYVKGGELREFQIHGLNFLAHHWCKGNNVILADEMGLGKTVQTISFMNWLRHDRGQNGPFIVVVPLSTMPAWADTFNFWTPDLNYVVYNGNEAARKIIRDYELLVNGNPRKVRFNVLLTTYEYILADSTFLSQMKWQFMAVDEAHRLKNRESQLYAKLMEFGAPSRLLITGTPMQNTLSELSALMDFLMPGRLNVDLNIDLTSEDASEKIAELTDAISPYMIRRTKQKVESDLPPKTEKIMRVELSDVQLEYYKNILTRNYDALNAGAKGGKTSLLNIMMELKKASNHPFMFPNAEERFLEGKDGRDDLLKALVSSSGKMIVLDRLLAKFKQEGHRVLIFSQMVRMLDILGDYLQLRGYQFQRLDGTIASGARRLAIDHFNAPDSSDFCFLLSTRAGGLGINLMTADTVILFDSDWNPQADLQAMARAHRIGQKKPVTIYRFVSKDTVEEEVLERARNKLMLEYITIQRGVTDKDAQDLGDRMVKAKGLVAEPTSADDISNILKKRGQKMFEQSGNQERLEALDIDAMLANAEEHKTEQPEGMTTDGGEEFLRSFEYTDVKIDLEWDDIIPKEQLEKMKEAERKRKEEQMLADLVEANQPRKRKAPVDEAREQRAAKKRARDLAVEAAGDMQSDDESDTGRDPRRALGEKECRLLIGAYERWGAMNEKQDEIVRDARLIGRDIDVVKDTLQEVISTAEGLLQAEEDRQVEFERTNNKQVTKKDKKAVLFDFRGVKRNNAGTLTERPREMRMIREEVERAPDWRNFRIPEASKPATYSCDWSAVEDGMLIVGMARHGFGAWVEIRDDEELNLKEKLFLEEHRVAAKEDRTKGGEEKQARSPGAVHLVRRANYLLSVLKDKTSNGANLAARKAIENHHRNNRKHMDRLHGRLSTPTHGSASPAPGRSRPETDPRRMHQSDIRHTLDRRGTHGSPNGHSRPRHSDDRRPQHHRNGSSPMVQTSGVLTNGNGTPMSEMDIRVRKFLQPISERLKPLITATKKNVPDDDKRLKMIKSGLLAIGSHILSQAQAAGLREHEEKIWDYVSLNHWPQSKTAEKRVSGPKLRDMHKKLGGKDTAAGNTAKSTPSKPKDIAPPTPSTATTNGSSHGTKTEESRPVKEEVKPEDTKTAIPVVDTEMNDVKERKEVIEEAKA
ncbi:ATP-dependent DNA helicase Hrp3 [Recurvomyces mirabilis]|uniref:ATP-dependent DNA helicase Hrp3 n=1 Tax=Recurvomyces mirabilis TaxID=574656 RepID=A0AAE0TS22_9PEZI|nr:ATP-dependent DNA helicase Hrp3 [Recurvomyces mirabilis]KAK5160150.1 ATP-dependent DNA helicase Hrp3 [Recurvomyces mirabilis]